MDNYLKALEEKYRELGEEIERLKKPPVLYKPGDYFVIHGEIYLLAQVKACEFELIGLFSGNRYTDSVKVELKMGVGFVITDEVITKLCNTDSFRKVDVACEILES